MHNYKWQHWIFICLYDKSEIIENLFIRRKDASKHVITNKRQHCKKSNTFIRQTFMLGTVQKVQEVFTNNEIFIYKIKRNWKQRDGISCPDNQTQSYDSPIPSFLHLTDTACQNGLGYGFSHTCTTSHYSTLKIVSVTINIVFSGVNHGDRGMVPQ